MRVRLQETHDCTGWLAQAGDASRLVGGSLVGSKVGAGLVEHHAADMYASDSAEGAPPRLNDRTILLRQPRTFCSTRTRPAATPATHSIDGRAPLARADGCTSAFVAP